MTDIAEMVRDPIGITVNLITGTQTGLEHAAVEAVVVGVAGGRAKRRKLAQAVAQRPTVLTDGKSPAPRVVGNLLIALVKAGATTISAPVCAECGKPLRTLTLRGLWRHRASAFTRPERAASMRSVSTRLGCWVVIDLSPLLH